jgi:hypothetical protein
MQTDSLEGIEDEIQFCQDICYIVAKCAGYWRTVPFALIVMSQYIKWFYLKQFSNMDEHTSYHVVGCLSPGNSCFKDRIWPNKARNGGMNHSIRVILEVRLWTGNQPRTNFCSGNWARTDYAKTCWSVR